MHYALSIELSIQKKYPDTKSTRAFLLLVFITLISQESFLPCYLCGGYKYPE